MRFAILNDNDTVVNIAVSDSPLAENWISSGTALIGDNYSNGTFITPSQDLNAQWAEVRKQRNALLAACDWTQLPDSPVDQSLWVEYRQALRDITLQANPFDIVWPEYP